MIGAGPPRQESPALRPHAGAGAQDYPATPATWTYQCCWPRWGAMDRLRSADRPRVL